MSDPILIAKGETDIFLLPQMANRHGLVAGATGTGKTVSLQVLAEASATPACRFFMTDVKGDLSGISQPARQQIPRSPSTFNSSSLRTLPFKAFRDVLNSISRFMDKY